MGKDSVEKNYSKICIANAKCKYQFDAEVIAERLILASTDLYAPY